MQTTAGRQRLGLLEPGERTGWPCTVFVDTKCRDELSVGAVVSAAQASYLVPDRGGEERIGERVDAQELRAVWKAAAGSANRLSGVDVSSTS